MNERTLTLYAGNIRTPMTSLSYRVVNIFCHVMSYDVSSILLGKNLFRLTVYITHQSLEACVVSMLT